jgi:DNA-binding MarR family transcriptional regulator
MSQTTLSPRSAVRKFDSLQQEVFLNLWRTYDQLRAFEDELFSKYDLTAQQYNALRLLRAAFPKPLATLHVAGQLVSRAPDITRLLDKLEKRGLVERARPAEDRRMVAITITDAGKRLLEILDDQVKACHYNQLGHMDEADLRRLIGLLRAARQPHENPDSPWK